ncbi:unnamed protein product [Adineta steineri]|uniref:Uncharacterized protein n=1 Tax=Adineta steineri TaxID=433720 RepID=A0A818LHQ0_9BILA|nr:unnamed protein product [Adineta steineri]CAF1039942.1 unnamed protein product [Adineta steineri]CAF3572359.1 unnamed protein product [Adineta steineri]CAF3703711.1 unnamed protein product [Adineta steineri]
MADMIKIWFQRDQNVPTKIKIDPDSDIDDLKEAIFGATDKGQYQATYNGVPLKQSAKVPQDTTEDIPVVFTKIGSVVSPHQNKTKFNKFKQNGIICAGGNGEGYHVNQFSFAEGIVIDHHNNIFIADGENHRIVERKCHSNEGQIIAGGNGRGNRNDQLSHPRDVLVDKQNNCLFISDFGNRRVVQCFRENERKEQILISDIGCLGLSMDKNGFIYISNCEKDEVRRWKMGEYNNEGIVVAGGNGKGGQLNQLNAPNFMFVDEDDSLYVSDQYNYRVIKWSKNAKKGIVVAGGNGQGNSLEQLSCPLGVAVDHLGRIYVVDHINHRVMRWCEENSEGEIVVGGNGCGKELNQLDHPVGLSFDEEENLYVVDQGNNRILKYEKCLD